MAEVLPVYWYVIIAVLWLGYLALEGFDLGVGMLVRFWARDEPRRRVLLNIIGPVWEGNEVWLITAVGAMFAAFPFWYAAVFSTLYLPMLVMLFGLILRAVSIEYRGKAATDAGREIWTWTLGIGSFLAAFMAGVLLVLTTTGLPLDANGDRVGGPFVWVTGPALLGGLAVVGFSLAQAWAFIGLKTDGAPAGRPPASCPRGPRWPCCRCWSGQGSWWPAATARGPGRCWCWPSWRWPRRWWPPGPAARAWPSRP